MEAKTQAKKSRVEHLFLFLFFPKVPCRVRALVPSQQTAHLPVQVRVEDLGKALGGGNARACPDLSIPTPMKLGHMACPRGAGLPWIRAQCTVKHKHCTAVPSL